MRIRAVSDWSLARRILVLQAVILVVVLGSALAALLYDTDAETERQTGERVTAIATTVAAAPTVRTSVTDIYPAGAEISAPSEFLQPYAERVRQQTNADFVVVMRPDGIRYTHPDPNADRPGVPGLPRRRPCRWGRSSRPTPARSDRRSGPSHR